VTLTSAAGLLLLADRHNLVSLKQLVLQRVLQVKGRYMADGKFAAAIASALVMW
jgi:hypothetical protein